VRLKQTVTKPEGPKNGCSESSLFALAGGGCNPKELLRKKGERSLPSGGTPPLSRRIKRLCHFKVNTDATFLTKRRGGGETSLNLREDGYFHQTILKKAREDRGVGASLHGSDEEG